MLENEVARAVVKPRRDVLYTAYSEDVVCMNLEIY